jgi:hypothetical protein
MHGTDLGRRVVPLLLTLALPACGNGTGTDPSPTPEPLGPTPVLLSPINNEQATSDTPTFTVRNAQGFDRGQANYMFRVTTASGQREIANTTVPAGSTRTSLTFATALPRGMSLSWSVVARNTAAVVGSSTGTFRTVGVACGAASSPYAKSVVDWFVPACNLAQNIYNDPRDTLGPPDGGGIGPNNFFGFLSLGDRGHVTVDMEACAVDAVGPDVRVYQFVGQEPVTLFAAGSPTGPFHRLAFRVLCGTRVPGFPQRRTCDFDLAAAEVDEARYFKVEDGEHFPCPGGTPSEGADIDAVEILHLK